LGSHSDYNSAGDPLAVLSACKDDLIYDNLIKAIGKTGQGIGAMIKEVYAVRFNSPVFLGNAYGMG
jgi:hypothetical protein